MYPSYAASSYAAQQDQSRNPFGPVDDNFPPIQSGPIRRTPWNDSNLFPGGGNWPAPPGSNTYTPNPLQPSHTTSFFQSPYQSPAAEGYGSLNNQQPTYGQNTGYASYGAQSPQPQPQYGMPQGGYANPNLAQFDPYSNNNNNPNAGSQWGQVQNSNPVSPGGYGGGGYDQVQGTQSRGTYQSLHPREFIRSNKESLEAWDQYSWKQALNSFDSLQQAWQSRYNQLNTQRSQYNAYPNPQLDSMLRAAQTNADAVAAASYQMKEAFQGYKLSSDPSSRKRVKEALNAGLTSLPDWPN